jgi:uncharacterized membrane protein
MTQRAAWRAGTALAALAALVVAVRVSRYRRSVRDSAERAEERTLTEQFTLPVERDVLYWLLRDPERAVRLFDPHGEAWVVGDTHARWTVTGPAGRPLTWVVETTGDVPEMMLAWSVQDGPLPHRGRVDLLPEDAGGTQVSVRVHYSWPAAVDQDAPGRVLRRAVDQLRAAAARSAYPRG